MTRSNTKPSETALIEAFQQAIQDSGLTLLAIQETSGISAGMLSRFQRGERGINLQTASKLAAILGYELVKCGDATALEKKPAKGK